MNALYIYFLGHISPPPLCAHFSILQLFEATDLVDPEFLVFRASLTSDWILK